MLIILLTGFSAGALHVIGGVDHFIAMAPQGLKKPKSALKAGFSWGLGHSAGVVILSIISILIKDITKIERLASFAELLVGVSLLVIGIIAIKTSLGLNIHTHNHLHSNGLSHEHIHLHLRGYQKHAKHTHTATSIGIIHGLAGGSHLIAIIPALALPPMESLFYIIFYLVGSFLAMGAVVITISLTTLKLGKKLFPLMFAFTGSISLITGIYWIKRTSDLFV